jgi:putative PIN family toxin of toxin-antitoxin system
MPNSAPRLCDSGACSEVSRARVLEGRRFGAGRRDSRWCIEGGIIYDTIVVPRIVLDTNVLVAGLRSNLGASHRVLSLIGTGRFTHVLSVALLFEHEASLTRPEVGIRLSREEIDDVLDYVCAVGERQQIYYLWRPALPDPSDDLVLEVAVHGGCDRIVTFNTRDFAGSERSGVRAETPAEFLRSLGASR